MYGTAPYAQVMANTGRTRRIEIRATEEEHTLEEAAPPRSASASASSTVAQLAGAPKRSSPSGPASCFTRPTPSGSSTRSSTPNASRPGWLASPAGLGDPEVVSDARPIEPLDSNRHHAKSFDCGQPSLNRWLLHAGQSERGDVARTFVVTDPELNVVDWLYTLVAAQVEHPAAAPSVSAGRLPALPDHHLPARVGRDLVRLASATSREWTKHR